MKIFGKILAVLLVASPAHAALVNCPLSFTTDGTAKVYYGAQLSAASACQYVIPEDQSNVANLTNINAAMFFGTNTWAANSATSLQVTPANGAAGTWSLTGANFATTDYMIVFKDGNDTNLIGFLLNGEATSGNWLTPFTEPPFDFGGGSTEHNVSHFSVVQRQCVGVCTPPPPPPPPPPPIPEPASMILLGLGMLGVARRIVRR